MIVADLGAGTGFYSIAAGRMVTHGKVYAIEVQKDFLPTIKDNAKRAGLKNIECFWGNVEKLGGTQIGDNVVDKVIASNILFQVENKDRFADEIKRILKPGGQVLVVDWSEVSSAMGPNVGMLISKVRAQEIFEKRGLVFKREINAGEHHYGIILEKL